MISFRAHLPIKAITLASTLVLAVGLSSQSNANAQSACAQLGVDCHWKPSTGSSTTSSRPARPRLTAEERQEIRAERERRKREAKARKDAARARKQEAKDAKEAEKRNQKAQKEAQINAKREAERRAKEEAQQRALEATQKKTREAEQQRFLAGRPALVSSLKVPAVSVPGAFASSPHPSAHAETAAGKGDQVQAAQAQLNELLKHQPPTAAEREQIAALEAGIRASWEQAADHPNPDARERGRLAVDLPVANTGEQVPHWKAFQPGHLGAFVPALVNPETSHPAGEAEYIHPVRLAMAQQVATDRYSDAVEKLGEGVMEARYGANGVRGFGTLLPVAKISWAAHKEGSTGAAAETVDFVIGKIPIPSAGFGWSGGKVASAASKEAFLQFLVSVNRATGKPDYDHEAAEKELERLTTENQSWGVRTVAKVLGW